MNDDPRLSADELIRRLRGTLSPWRRLRGAVALVAGLTGAAFIGLLWATEPGPLPGRLHLAFGMFTVVCLTWAGYGAWAVTRGAPLYAMDRVIAAWLALTASTATTALLTVIALRRDSGLTATLTVGIAFIAASAASLVRAHTRRTALLRRIRELQTRDDQD
ncbi:hypothetical protein [Rhizohabitans arisaemae]|uniref:hypothetical protein n=1 Tax=Rhizohabitans arisaemae TaxID=2720610 RepID=UPI0024B08DE6|nr:hypothetical protein [Rhizohabitans arisaemae]